MSLSAEDLHKFMGWDQVFLFKFFVKISDKLKIKCFYDMYSTLLPELNALWSGVWVE